MSENGPEKKSIECWGQEGDSRGVYFHSREDSTSVLQGFKVIYGSATLGGAIYCEDSSPGVLLCAGASGDASEQECIDPLAYAGDALGG